MKKLLSLLLALALLLALVGCGADSAPTAQQPVTEATAPEGTTLPLYWPPLPEETQSEELESLPRETESAQIEQSATLPRETNPVQPETLGEQEQPTKDTRPQEDDTPSVPTTQPDSGEDIQQTPSAPQTENPEPTKPQETQPPTTQPQIDYQPDPEPEPETQPVTTQPQVDYEPRPDPEPERPQETQAPSSYLDPNGSYDSKRDVALYIHTYGCLPNNYITKRQAQALGWSGGSLERYAPGKCIGGDRFYNNEGLLPRGHTYYECDIGTLGKSSRGAQRIVYSTDGLVYYTSNHYASFTLLYGSP